MERILKMPWIDNSELKDTPSYYLEPKVYAYDVESVNWAIEQKKNHAKLREALLIKQKECGKEFREIAKFCGQEAAHQMKMYRGLCWAISVIAANPPGDCKNLQMDPQLAKYADWAFSAIDLEWHTRVIGE